MWAAFLPIIAQYGLPVAEKLWQKVTTGKDPTQADWDELNKIAAQTSLTQMQDALARAGIPLDDPKAAPFLALVR